ncbi:putative membrane protein [Purpureocillium lavendulum]|uniref:Membrane protein n=1 Tax=Purpureocillium lavendulum TaxID=1247861 RepID=A0AB34G6S3_9HYPO|nr:putative membrane protein [Purpureocillium lavendulum]
MPTPATISLMYPPGPFNIKYFTETHMPFVSETWGSEGLESWEVTQFEPGAPYMVLATLKFESASKWEAASKGSSGMKVWNDVANFTTVQPEIYPGKSRGSHRTTLKEKKIFGS